jgi:hypothetical protein
MLRCRRRKILGRVGKNVADGLSHRLCFAEREQSSKSVAPTLRWVGNELAGTRQRLTLRLPAASAGGLAAPDIGRCKGEM